MLSYVFVAFLSVLLAVLFIPRDWSVRFGDESSQGPRVRLLSRHELSLYDGEEGSKGLYLAILGQVFDVHKGYKHYGPGGAYHFMAGDYIAFKTCYIKYHPNPSAKLNYKHYFHQKKSCTINICICVCVCILRQRCLTGFHHWRLHREWPDR